MPATPLQGIISDLRNRLPYYVSDWTDALNYRVIPSTVYMFFTNLLPAIAFAQDMFDRTENSYGLNEVLLASALGGIVFGVFGGQPLCIVGVTGPISIFNYTVYDMVKNRPDCNYFAFMCWIGLWSCLFHMLVAAANLVAYTRLITRYSCDAFGLFINCIYVQKGIQILSRQFKKSDHYSSGFYSVCVGMLMAVFGVGAHAFGTKTRYIHHNVRKFFADYGTPLCIVFFTGFTHFNNTTLAVKLEKLEISKLFHPTNSTLRENDWFIRFWRDISVKNVFLALPFALLLTLLFYFDHNVSSLMAQDSRFKLKKPSGFHWDFFLLGITTGIAGLIGIPFPNGLIPQAPLHTTSLQYYRRVAKEKTENEKEYEMEYCGVIEQRASNTAQGLLTLGMMSRPLLVVLGTVPQAVFAGLFFIMGITGLDGNEIVARVRYLCSEKKLLKKDEIFQKDGKKLSNEKWLWLFVLFSLTAFGFEFAICQTKAAIAFPAVLLFFAGLALYFDNFFPQDDLEVLDEPTGSKELLDSLKMR